MTLSPTMKQMSLFSLLLTALMSSTLVALNTTNWFLLWAALEINMISFLPLLFFSRLTKSWNTATEYFFPQAGGSLLILVATIVMLFHPQELQTSSLIIFLAMMLKGGFAPFHYWFINIFSNTESWAVCFILSTWQKLVPVFTLSNTHPSNTTTPVLLFSILGATWGMAMAANQTNMQSFVAYSSVGNLGWFLALTPTSQPAALSFFLLYSLLLAVLLIIFVTFSPNTAPLSSSCPPVSFPQKLTISLCLLSLAGFPPTTGFLLKIWVLLSVSASSFLISWVMFFPLLLSMAAYARFTFYFLFNHHSKTDLPPSQPTTSQWLPLASVLALHCSPVALTLLPPLL